MTDKEIKEQPIENFKDEYKVYQPNPMLMVYDNMTNIWQARFLKAYQAKVRPSNPDTYRAKFALDEFLNALNLSKTPSVQTLKEIAASIRTIGFDFCEYRRKYGNEKLDPMLIKAVNLFEYFEISGSEEEGYYVEAYPTRIMETMLQGIAALGYVDYEIKNVLCFSSKRTIRFYEFLKRSEGKNITIKVDELKIYLGIPSNRYPDTRTFTRDVVKKEITEINKETDIVVDYKPILAQARGSRTIGYNFIIKPKAKQDLLPPTKEPQQVTFDDYDEETRLQEQREQRDQICRGFSNEIFDEFDLNQLAELRNLAWNKVSNTDIKKHQTVYEVPGEAKQYAVSEYITEKILYTNTKTIRKDRYSYIKGAVTNDWK